MCISLAMGMGHGGAAGKTSQIAFVSDCLQQEKELENRGSSPHVFFIHRGRMIPSELERLVERDRADGKSPFFVNATAGTTVTGSYDPINAIADVAEKHGMWLHVDVSTRKWLESRAPNF